MFAQWEDILCVSPTIHIFFGHLNQQNYKQIVELLLILSYFMSLTFSVILVNSFFQKSIKVGVVNMCVYCEIVGKDFNYMRVKYSASVLDKKYESFLSIYLSQ